VDLYQSTPGATLKDIAADLGISRGTLAHWVQQLGTPTTPPAATPPRPSAASYPRSTATPRPAAARRQEPQAARIAELEARVAELEAEQTKLATERDILRQAAKYFAGETNW
jgi:transposase